MRRRRIIFGLLLLIASCAADRGLVAAEVVETTKVDALAKPLVDGGWIYGAAVGLINDKGTQIIGYGRHKKVPGPLAGRGLIDQRFSSAVSVTTN